MEPSPENDIWLVRRAAGGDQDAFEPIYRTHVAAIFTLCLRISGDVQSAEELTQETFLQAWRSLSTLRDPEALHAWLRRLATNIALTDLRRLRRWSFLVERIVPDTTLERGGSGSTPEDRMDLWAAVRRLPRAQRAVFVLHDVEGYKHREVAQMMGLSTGTTKVHLHRARKFLREALAP